MDQENIMKKKEGTPSIDEDKDENRGGGCGVGVGGHMAFVSI